MTYTEKTVAEKCIEETLKGNVSTRKPEGKLTQRENGEKRRAEENGERMTRQRTEEKN